MKMVNLKNEQDEATCAPCPVERYGYGLRLMLDDDACEALGITKALRAGSQVKLQALAVVVTSTESLERDGDDKGNDIGLTLQITDMGVEPAGVLRNAAAVLYGDG